MEGLIKAEYGNEWDILVPSVGLVNPQGQLPKVGYSYQDNSQTEYNGLSCIFEYF